MRRRVLSLGFPGTMLLVVGGLVAVVPACGETGEAGLSEGLWEAVTLFTFIGWGVGGRDHCVFEGPGFSLAQDDSGGAIDAETSGTRGGE